MAICGIANVLGYPLTFFEGRGLLLYLNHLV